MSQNTTKAKPIKAVGGYNKKSPTENLASANAVHSGIFTDPADYPTPPIDELTFKGAIDTLSTKITAALDGGKKAIADRNHQEQVVIKMVRPLTKCVGRPPLTARLEHGQRNSSPKRAQPPQSRALRRERTIRFRSVPSPMRPGSAIGAIRLPVSVPSRLTYSGRELGIESLTDLTDS